MEDQQQQEPNLTVDQRYWLDRRADIIAALEAEGLQIWSDKDRVWLHRIGPASPSSSVLERAREALKDMTQWVAAFAMDAGSHGIVMASPRMEKARSALAEIDRALGGGNAE